LRRSQEEAARAHLRAEEAERRAASQQNSKQAALVDAERRVANLQAALEEARGEAEMIATSESQLRLSSTVPSLGGGGGEGTMPSASAEQYPASMQPQPEQDSYCAATGSKWSSSNPRMQPPQQRGAAHAGAAPKPAPAGAPSQQQAAGATAPLPLKRASGYTSADGVQPNAGPAQQMTLPEGESRDVETSSRAAALFGARSCFQPPAPFPPLQELACPAARPPASASGPLSKVCPCVCIM